MLYPHRTENRLKSSQLTNAVPASATNAERKLKKRAFETVKPDLTRIPKSPICTKSAL